MLIAIDGSEGSFKTVGYVGQQFEDIHDLQITLFYVLPGVPPQLWDDGHILTEEEKTARKVVLDKWLSNQKLRLDSIFQPAIEVLAQKGINPQQIETKATSESVKNTAECILAEARMEQYQTLVMGQCSASRTTHALMGSIVSRVMNHGPGIVACVVE